MRCENLCDSSSSEDVSTTIYVSRRNIEAYPSIRKFDIFALYLQYL